MFSSTDSGRLPLLPRVPRNREMDKVAGSEVVNGIKWNYLAAFAIAAFQLVFTAILARLVEPSAYGLIAMANAILRFGSYFAQMGVGNVIIQRPQLNEQDIHTAFTSATVLGAICTTATYIFAPLARYVFDSKDVIPIIQVMGFSFLFTGLSTTALSLLRRKLSFRALALTDFASYVLSYALLGIPLAWMGYGVWALVTAMIGQQIIAAIALLSLEWHSLRLSLEWQSHRKMLGMGGHYSFNTVLEALASNIDTFFVGRFLGDSILGIYNRAWVLANLPAQSLISSVTKVIFPYMAGIQNDKQKLRKTYCDSLLLLALVFMPLLIGIIPAAEEIVLVLLGDKWITAVPILRALAIVVFFMMATTLAGILADSTGHLKEKSFIQMALILFLIPAFLVAYSHGPVIVAVVLAVSYGGRFLIYQVFVRRWLSVSWRNLMTALLPPSFLSGTVCVSIWFVHTFISVGNKPILLGIEITAAALICGLYVMLIPPPVLQKILTNTCKIPVGRHGNYLDFCLSIFRKRFGIKS